MTEDEMAGWHHQLNGLEFEQTPRDSDGQGSLACCNPWRPRHSEMTQQLNNKEGSVMAANGCKWEQEKVGRNRISFMIEKAWWGPVILMS